MKKLLFVLLFAGLAATASAQVKFETKSTDAVREMAVKASKLVFIDLYATWCPPCRMMERDVFSRRDVGEFMAERFVSAKYDIDKPTGRELMQKYEAKGVPTYLIFDTDGTLLGRLVGASTPEQFMDNIDTILSRNRRQ